MFSYGCYFEVKRETMARIKNPKRMVIKIGTSTLTYETGKTNIRRMAKLVSVLSDLKNAGTEIILVSSGAIGVGVGKLGLSERPRDTKGRQAAAAVGQCELMFMYDKLFSEYGHNISQLLITKSDVENPERRQNLINTFSQLFAYGALPIVNENDCVAVDEIVYGDNDVLSATVATLVEADVLVMLTDIDGLYSADPREDEDAQIINTVTDIDGDLRALAGGRGSTRGTGGMITKLNAAEICCEAGIAAVIMNGASPTDLYKVVEGRQIGTFFVPKKV